MSVRQPRMHESMEGLPPEALEQVAAYFQALSEPTRLQILNLLRSGERSVGELAQLCGYTSANISRHLGLLKEGVYESRFTLAEVRVLRELISADQLTASQIGDALGMDAAFLSKILSRFERDGLVRRSPAEHDGRQKLLSITSRGRQEFAPLEVRAHEQVAVLPEASVAVQVMVVVPTGKGEPDGGTQATVAPGQLSEAVGVP